MKPEILGTANAKTSKGEDLGYKTYIQYLVPYGQLGLPNLCPSASEGCGQACLFTAGRGKFSNVQEARYNKTKRYVTDRVTYVDELIAEIVKAGRRHSKSDTEWAVRLNGTSDLNWQGVIKSAHRSMLTEGVTKLPKWYDYTKVKTRDVVVQRLADQGIDYDLTFSRSETNHSDCVDWVRAGGRAAFVYSGSMPKTLEGMPVISGDDHDLRFLDPKGVWVALKAKGDAKKDTTGFVIHN